MPCPLCSLSLVHSQHKTGASGPHAHPSGVQGSQAAARTGLLTPAPTILPWHLVSHWEQTLPSESRQEAGSMALRIYLFGLAVY